MINTRPAKVPLITETEKKLALRLLKGYKKKCNEYAQKRTEKFEGPAKILWNSDISRTESGVIATSKDSLYCRDCGFFFGLTLEDVMEHLKRHRDWVKQQIVS